MIFIIIVIIILNIFKKQFFLKALKSNSNLKKFYKKYRNSSVFKKTNTELLNLFLIFFMQKFTIVYKEYPLVLFLILVVYSYLLKNILLLSIFCCHWLYDEIVALPYFSNFKKTREEDIRRFNFHWNFDRDLVFLNKVLIVAYSIGFGITYFSYFFYYTSLGELGVEHFLLLFNYTLSIKDVQYFLSMNFIGPSILILCIILKLLLNMHVIFFRNPSTILKGFASLATTKNIAGFSTFILTFSGTFLGFNGGYHASIGPQNTIKNFADSIGDGVVRHTPLEDHAFLLMKKHGANLNPKDIVIDNHSKRLDIAKLQVELSLPKHASVVLKMSATELNSIGCANLISDLKLLRHNLNVCCNLANGTSSKEEYILRCNDNDRNLRLSLGIESPSKDELHVHYQLVLAKTCASPKDIANLNAFLKGESDTFIYSFKFQKEFGFLSDKKSWVSSVYVDSSKLETKSDCEKVASKIPPVMLDGYRTKPIHPSEVTDENIGEILRNRINRPMPLLIKNEPENP